MTAASASSWAWNSDAYDIPGDIPIIRRVGTLFKASADRIQMNVHNAYGNTEYVCKNGYACKFIVPNGLELFR